MKYLTSLSLASLAGLTLATSSNDLTKRAEFCGQWDTGTDGNYIVYNDLWGESSATSGSQCTDIVSLSGNTLTWYTSWSWEGISYDVKSFANAEYVITPKQLSSISSIPTTWKWRLAPPLFLSLSIKVVGTCTNSHPATPVPAS